MSDLRPGIVVQARVGSTRLPGKVLLRVQGDTLLGHLLRRLEWCREARCVVVAAPSGHADESVLSEARLHGARAFAGPEDDVLSRYVGAAREFDLDPVVRVTADCPLIDPAVADDAVARFARLAEEGAAVDVVTNARPGARTFPRGLDVEVVSRSALENADSRLAPDAPQREHVTQILYQEPGRLRIEDLKLPLDLSFLRWTVDTADDFELVRRVYDELFVGNPGFGLHDVLALLGRHPELLALNAHVRQKEA
jgi:spore coat polysaccharide biosynthesis protein SpsF